MHCISCELNNVCDEIAKEEKVFERNDRFSFKTPILILKNNTYMNKGHISLDITSLLKMLQQKSKPKCLSKVGHTKSGNY